MVLATKFRQQMAEDIFDDLIALYDDIPKSKKGVNCQVCQATEAMWQCDSISSHKQKPTSEVEKGAVEQKPDPEETKALAEALKESGDALDKKFGPAIKVIQAEVLDIFKNHAEMTYAAFTTFLRDVLKQDGNDVPGVNAYVMISLAGANVVRKHGVGLWGYFRRYLGEYHADDAVRWRDELQNHN